MADEVDEKVNDDFEVEADDDEMIEVDIEVDDEMVDILHEVDEVDDINTLIDEIDDQVLDEVVQIIVLDGHMHLEVDEMHILMIDEMHKLEHEVEVLDELDEVL